MHGFIFVRTAVSITLTVTVAGKMRSELDSFR